ncbi:class I SAM-dependent methyltransferase [Alphaproteobacteria bacterium]|nr:class I SAM-dependent methyltransferase [Alphaproteobacteria bacterium]
MKENPQREHYESIHSEYESHYYDKASMNYRHRFIYKPLLKNIDLNGLRVADLACGSGHNSMALKQYFPEVETVGYDISSTACKDYVNNTGNRAFELDLTMPFEPKETFDAAIVIGGLHHCINDLSTTFDNISKMLKPGGLLLMMEPNDDFILSSIRRIWYKRDHWFESNTEEALKHDIILDIAQPNFKKINLKYFGGPAFYLILNSLIMRVPSNTKPLLSKILFPIETFYEALPTRQPFAAFLAVWKKE